MRGLYTIPIPAIPIPAIPILTIPILAIPLLAFESSQPARSAQAESPAAQFVHIESRSGRDCPGHRHSTLVNGSSSRAISATIRTWSSNLSAPYCQSSASNMTRIVPPGGEQEIGCNLVAATPMAPCGYSVHYDVVSATYVN